MEHARLFHCFSAQKWACLQISLYLCKCVCVFVCVCLLFPVSNSVIPLQWLWHSSEPSAPDPLLRWGSFPWLPPHELRWELWVHLHLVGQALQHRCPVPQTSAETETAVMVFEWKWVERWRDLWVNEWVSEWVSEWMRENTTGQVYVSKWKSMTIRAEKVHKCKFVLLWGLTDSWICVILTPPNTMSLTHWGMLTAEKHGHRSLQWCDFWALYIPSIISFTSPLEKIKQDGDF